MRLGTTAESAITNTFIDHVLLANYASLDHSPVSIAAIQIEALPSSARKNDSQP